MQVFDGAKRASRRRRSRRAAAAHPALTRTSCISTCACGTSGTKRVGGIGCSTRPGVGDGTRATRSTGPASRHPALAARRRSAAACWPGRAWSNAWCHRCAARRRAAARSSCECFAAGCPRPRSRRRRPACRAAGRARARAGRPGSRWQRPSPPGRQQSRRQWPAQPGSASGELSDCQTCHQSATSRDRAGLWRGLQASDQSAGS